MTHRLARHRPFLFLLPVVLALLALAIPVAADGPSGEPDARTLRREMKLHTVVTSDGRSYQTSNLTQLRTTADAAQESFEPPAAGEPARLGGNGPSVAPVEDLEAHEVLPAEGFSPSSVTPPDGREPVRNTTSYPFRAITHLSVTWPAGRDRVTTCTGWLIGPRTVATAGHCVYNRERGGWAVTIRATPGRNGEVAPYGFADSHRLFSVRGWTSLRHADYDYGAIQLKAPIGERTGYFGFRWTADDSALQGLDVKTHGYPGDKPRGTMWGMSGPIARVAPRALFYPHDAYGGQSGSPVYRAFNSVCCSSVAIHAHDKDLDPARANNSGPRITEVVFNNLRNWKYHVYP